MVTIHTSKIEEAVYNLCVQANTEYNQYLYNIVFSKYQKCSRLLKTLSTRPMARKVVITDEPP